MVIQCLIPAQKYDFFPKPPTKKRVKMTSLKESELKAPNGIRTIVVLTAESSDFTQAISNRSRRLEEIKASPSANGLARINETTLNRIIRHGENGFVILSANKGQVHYENPELDLTNEYNNWLAAGARQTDDSNDHDLMDEFLRERNKKEHTELANDIKKAGWSYSIVYGGHKDEGNKIDSFEPSFIVYNHKRGSEPSAFEELFDFAIRMCAKYKQDSVYIQEPGKSPDYYDMHGDKSNQTSSMNFKYDDFDAEYLTTVKRKKRNDPQRFTADIQFEMKDKYYKNKFDFTERVRRKQNGEILL